MHERATFVHEIVYESALYVTVLGKVDMRMTLLEEKPIRKSKGTEENDIPETLKARKKDEGWMREGLVELPDGNET